MDLLQQVCHNSLVVGHLAHASSLETTPSHSFVFRHDVLSFVNFKSLCNSKPKITETLETSRLLQAKQYAGFYKAPPPLC